jgi:hypothetical protein
MRIVERGVLAILATCSIACADRGDRGVNIDGLEVVFDEDGFDDGRVSVQVARFSPGGVVAAPDGALFVHGHAMGHGDDAAPDGRDLMIKIRPDGRPDATFGDGGVFALPEVRDGFVDVAVLPDASVAALGSIDGVPVVWKIAADGSLDAAFGDAGLVAIEIDGAGDQSANGIALAPRDDGSLDIVGRAGTDESWGSFAARVSATGALEIANAFPAIPDTWWGVLIDATGSTLVFGERSTATDVQPLVGRLTDALEFDPAFGPDGYARIGTVASYCREPIALVGGGYAAAGSDGQGASDFGGAVLVMTAAGELDPTFDGDGHLAIDGHWVFAVAELPSGDLLAQVQPTETVPGPPEYVIHISRAGILDASFGEAGRSTGDGMGVGLVTGAGGESWAAGYEWPDTMYVRRI